MTPQAPFDVFTASLHGTQLVEASAGTGKTWTLTALHLRLLLEVGLPITSILVVTFTEAAVAELRTRVRQRLLDARRLLEAKDEHTASVDPAVVRIVAQARECVVTPLREELVTSGQEGESPTDALLRQRVLRALAEFDDAPIRTIHAFCQQLLREQAFAAGLPLEVETVTDDTELRLAAVKDFWRREVATPDLPPPLAQWLARSEAKPQGWEPTLRDALAFPLARPLWGDEDDQRAREHLQNPVRPELVEGLPRTNQGLRQAQSERILPREHPQNPVRPELVEGLPHTNRGLRQAQSERIGVMQTLEVFERARASWRRQADAAIESLVKASSGVSYTRVRIERAHTLWQRHFEHGTARAAPSGDPKLLRLYGITWLRGAKKIHDQVPRMALFDDIQALLDTHAALEQRLRHDVIGLKRRMVDEAARSLDEAKRAQGVRSFQDMLTRTRERLRDDASLATVVRRRWPAALIDEFQDTDPVQLEIVERLYPHADAGSADRGTSTRDGASVTDNAASVFLVGDPKQAIYGFRGADLESYLRARTQVARNVWSLDSNQRASPQLLEALNALWSSHARVFGNDRLVYRRSEIGSAPRKAFVDARSRDGNGNGNEDCAALRLWSLPATIDTAARAEAAAARACADDIARTLDGARDEQVHYGGRPLRGGEIAVLVRTNREGRLMRHALADAGVASVELSPVSVFSSLDAAEVECLLHAVLEPSHAGKLRAAMATTLLGADAALLAALGSRDDGAGEASTSLPSSGAADAFLEATLARLLAWRNAWQRHGVAAMLARVFDEAGVAQRLLPARDGERRMTNLLHLMELLSEQAQATPLPRALLRWLGQQRAAPRTGDENLLRLESDRELVQIVTVHRAKGLQYALVYLPFLWRDGKPKPGEGARRWHDDDGRQVLDFRGKHAVADNDPGRLAAKDEASAETLRLIYVALTRAEHRCTLVVDTHVRAGDSNQKNASLRAMLNWIAAAPVVAPSLDLASWRKVGDTDAALERSAQIARAWQALATATPHVGLVELPTPTRHARRHHDDDTPEVHLVTPPGPIEASWRLGSFSSFVHGDAAAAELAGLEPALDTTLETTIGGIDRDTPVDQVSDDDDAAIGEEIGKEIDGEIDRAIDGASDDVSVTAGAELEPDTDDILRFPRGPSAGDAMHAALERADFTRRDTWPTAAAAALRLHPQRPAAGDAQVMLEHMLRDVTATPLVPGLKLRDVGPAQRSNELEFDLPMHALRLDRLQVAMQRAGLPVPPLGRATSAGGRPPLHGHVHGHVRGFVDTVFEHQGRWYLADWKSNHLGDAPRDYAQPALARVIAAQGYHLQHVLYAIALLRHLRRCLGEPQAHAAWGGAFVLFVRGMRPGWVDSNGRATGVHHQRLEPRVLDELARCFG